MQALAVGLLGMLRLACEASRWFLKMAGFTSLALRLYARWQQAHADHRRIATGFVIVSLFVALAKGMAAFKEMAVAWRYGTSPVVDGYLFGTNLVLLPVSIWFSVLTVVLLPLVGRAATDDPLRLRRFRAELLGLTLGLGLLAYPLARWGLGLLVTSGWSGLHGTAADTVLAMAPWLALLLPLGLVASLWSAWTMAGGGHRNTLFEGIPAVCILVAVLALPGAAGETLLWGTVGGFLVQAACLAVPLATRKELEAPGWDLTSPHWAPFRQGFLVMLAAQVLMGLGGILDQFAAARLGEGAIATLGYANRLLALALGLGATAVSRAILPVLSGMAEGDAAHRQRLVRRWVGMMLGVGVIAAAIGWLLAPWGVRVLFQRGAFTAGDTAAVAQMLRWSLLMVPCYMANLVLVANLTSQRRYGIFIRLNAVNLTVKAGLLFVLVPILGIAGVPLSGVGMYVVSCLGLHWASHRKVGR